jgi:hypothetical protein
MTLLLFYTLQITRARSNCTMSSLGISWQRIPKVLSTRTSVLTSLSAGHHLVTGPTTDHLLAMTLTPESESKSKRKREFFFNLCRRTLGSAATTVLLYQPWMIGDGECGEIGGMKIGRGSRPQRHFVHHKSHMTRPRFEPGPPRWEAND